MPSTFSVYKRGNLPIEQMPLTRRFTGRKMHCEICVNIFQAKRNDSLDIRLVVAWKTIRRISSYCRRFSL